MATPIHISYFSDVLCVWAYVAQIRLDELKNNFRDKIQINPYHVTLFGDCETRIGQGWQERGGYAGFGDHVLDVGRQFPHAEINSDVWHKCQPRTSANAHLFLKAIQLLVTPLNNCGSILAKQQQIDLMDRIDWSVRQAFFRDAIDIGQLNNLYPIAESFDLPINQIEQLIQDGSAMALLCRDMQLKETKKLDGSPTYLLNESRQKLFGNVGYKIIEANLLELLEVGKEGQASWC